MNAKETKKCLYIYYRRGHSTTESSGTIIPVCVFRAGEREREREAKMKKKSNKRTRVN